MIICTILVNINLYMLSFLISEVDESTAINDIKRCGGLIVKHNLMIILLMSIILLVGCQLNKKADTEGEKSAKSVEPKYMETEDYPDVSAFQDEFTREFLQSTEETRQGYYPFLSGTEGFELDFPTEGKLGERSYNIKNKSFEALMINVGNEESNIVHNITVNYYGHLEESFDSTGNESRTSIQNEIARLRL